MPIVGGDSEARLRAILAAVQGAARKANAKRAELRDTLAYALVNPGKGAEGDPQALATHEAWMQGAAEGLGQVVQPNAARALLEGLGVANEEASGVLSFLGGSGFYGQSGYDSADLDANTRGIERGLATLPPEPALSEMDLIDPALLGQKP